METALIVLSGIVLVAIVIIIYCMARIRELHARAEFLRQYVETESKKRVEKSRSVILGQVTEHFAPILPGFPYNPKDARFVGQPVDYLILNGINDEVQGEKRVEIVLCEIKSGESRLSANERAIRDAVEAGRVRFETLRLSATGMLETE